jgi:AraC-like DNA-binding protein
MVCARLLRAYTYLRGPGSRLKEVAAKLGYLDPGILSEQLRDWTGYAPREIGHAVQPAEYVQLLADHLRRADTEEQGAVEPV